mgnify:CR=1 FL=1
MAHTMVTKFLSVFYYTWLSGGVLMQIPPVTELLGSDRIDTFVYNGILVITALLWAAKYILNLYEKKREIDDRFKRK